MRVLTAWKMLVHDRSSTAGALLGVVAIVFLVGQQLSILFGLLNYMSVLVDHSGADAWILSAKVQNADAGNYISSRYLDRIVGLPEIEWAEPLLIGNGLFRKDDGSFESVRIVGVRRPGLIGGPWEFAKSDNRALLDQEAIAVDRLDLPKLGNPKLGQIVEIGGRRVRIGAVTNGARGFQGTLVFANLELTREIAKVPAGRYSAILVRFRPGVDKTNVIEKMRKILRNCSVYSSEELSSLTQRYYLSNTGIGGSFGFSTVIAVLIGVVIITLTMYSSVLNRQRDFAVIRALGARKGDIVLIVLTQAFLISLMGILLGFLLLSFLFRATLNSAIPSYYPTFIPPIHALLTILFSLFGSFFALRKALKAEPASVFH